MAGLLFLYSQAPGYTGKFDKNFSQKQEIKRPLHNKKRAVFSTNCGKDCPFSLKR